MPNPSELARLEEEASNTPSLTVEVTQAEVDAALATFNGGLVRQTDERNARGYTTFYHPRDSIRLVLENFARHRLASVGD